MLHAGQSSSLYISENCVRVQKEGILPAKYSFEVGDRFCLLQIGIFT
jgi:hypothetical protein